MTAKEKAEELVMKLFQKQIEITGNGDGNLCVEMALIAVTEIINSNPHSNPFNTDVHSTMKYWQEVKKEIEKL